MIGKSEESARLGAIQTVAAFDNWLLRWRRGEDPEKGFLAEGAALAKKRRAALKELIVRDPKSAIEHVVPKSFRKQLPAEVQEQLETQIDTYGRYELTVACSENGSVYSRKTEVGGNYYDTYTYGNRLNTLSKSRLAVHGIAIDEKLALSSQPYRLLDADEQGTSKQHEVAGLSVLSGTEIKTFSSLAELKKWAEAIAVTEQIPGPETTEQVSAEAASASWVNGAKTVLWMVAEYPDDPGSPATPAQIASCMEGVNNYYTEVSRAKTSYKATVLPLNVQLSKLKIDYTSATMISAEALAAARAYDKANGGTGAYDPDKFDRWIVVTKKNSNFSWAGLALVGYKGLWLLSIQTGVVAHELGHNQGLHHSHSWQPTGSSSISPGTHVEYGDRFDVMGDAYSLPLGHFNTRQKLNLGYLASSEISRVTQSGTYRIQRSDSYDATGIQAIQISAGNDYDYWVEFRQSASTSLTRTQSDRLLGGALIHWGTGPSFTTGEGTYLLDMTPGTPSTALDAALAKSETFTDADYGLSITPLASGGTDPSQWIDVAVSIGATGSNHNPVISSLATANSVKARTNASFSAEANDPDSDPIKYRWDFGDGTTAPNTATVNHRWLKGGTFAVSVSVTDGRGGIGSKTTNVSVDDPLLTWTQRGSGLTPYSIYSIVFGGGRFVAPSTDGSILVSSDGINWTLSKGLENQGFGFFAVTYAAGRYIAAGGRYDSTTQQLYCGIISSPDGVQWRNDSPSAKSGPLWGVAYGAGRYVVVGSEGLLMQSADGVSWTQVNLGTSAEFYAVTFAAGRFVATGSGGMIFTSTDGITWVNKSVLTTSTFTCVTYYNGAWWASAPGYALWKSTDGLNWVAPSDSTYSIYYGLSASKEGFLLGADYDDHVILTEDGVSSASYVISDTSNTGILYGLAEGNGSIVCVGTKGRIFQTTNSASTPQINTQPSAQTLSVGGALTLSVGASGSGTLSYQWKKNGVAIAGATSSSYTINTVTTADAGSYTVVVTNGNGSVESNSTVVTVNTDNPGRMTAMSVRSLCGSGDNILIAGYLLQGSGKKQLVIRGIGPNLLKSGVSSVLEDPLLKIFSAGTESASNDNWSGSDGHEYGPAALDAGSKDACLYVTQSAGAYTAQISGVRDGTGNSMVEVYDSEPSRSDMRFTALSIRTSIAPGDRVIPGLIVSGGSPRKVIIRAIGPSMSLLGVANGLTDPKIELYSGSSKIQENDDWSGENGSSIGLQSLPSGSKDAVMVASLQPGIYTIHVYGNGAAAGIALIEIYEMP